MAKVVLITGASSGIGYATAKLLAQEGNKVYAGARRMERMEPLKEFGVVPMYLDVTDEVSAKAMVDAVIAAEGRIDVLFNNAGYGSYGPIEVVPLEEAQRQMDVNVFGVARMCQLVLPYMRQQGSGRIINTSSVGGQVTSYLGGWYHASKYALEALSNAIRMDVSKMGIDVAIIEPAGVTTEWGGITADNLEKCGKGTAYQETTAKIASVYRNMYSKESFMVDGVDKTAKIVSKAVNAKKPKVRYRYGMGKMMVFMSKFMPARFFDWMMRYMYESGLIK